MPNKASQAASTTHLSCLTLEYLERARKSGAATLDAWISVAEGRHAAAA